MAQDRKAEQNGWRRALRSPRSADVAIVLLAVAVALITLLVIAVPLSLTWRATAEVKPKPYSASVFEEPKLEDVRYVDMLVNAPEQKKAFESTILPSPAAARAAFPHAKFPRQTFGRKLVSIILQKVKPTAKDGRKSLLVIYEGQLVVAESSYCIGPLSPECTGGSKVSTPSPLTSAAAATLGSLSQAEARLTGDDTNYVVSSPNMSDRQLTMVTWSLAP